MLKKLITLIHLDTIAGTVYEVHCSIPGCRKPEYISIGAAENRIRKDHVRLDHPALKHFVK